MGRRVLKLAMWMAVIASAVDVLAGQQPRTANADNRNILKDPAFLRGKALYEAGNYADAATALNQALQKHPKGSYGYWYRASTNAKLWRMPEAVDDAEKAVTYSEGEAYASKIRGNVIFIYTARARQVARKGDYAGAVRDYTRVTELAPDYGPAYWLRSTVEFRMGRYQEVINDLDHWLAKSKGPTTSRNLIDSEIALAMRGRAFLSLGNADAARDHVDLLIKTEPRLARAYGGANGLDLYDVDKRCDLARHAIAMAELSEQKGKPEEAFRLFEVARCFPLIVTEIVNGEQFDLIDYGIAERELVFKIDEGLRRLYAQLATKPPLPEEARRYVVQAEGAALEQRFDDAARYFKRALGIAPWWSKGYYNLALLAERKREFAVAIGQMKHYLVLAPDPASARQAQDKIYAWEGKTGAGPPR